VDKRRKKRKRKGNKPMPKLPPSTPLKEGRWVKTSTGVKDPTPRVYDKHATEPTEPMIPLPYAGLVASGVERPRIRRFWKLIHEGKKKIGPAHYFKYIHIFIKFNL
jgi:hypothetical protein